MITHDYFITAITNLSHLTGQRIPRSTADLFYQELKDTNYNDFKNALNNLKYSEKRITLGSLYQAISLQQSERLERENTKQKAWERIEAAKFFQENKQYIDQGHCNRLCIKCPVKYCRIIKDHSIQAIRDMLNGIKTLNQINNEMNDKFQGWNTGFNLEPF